MVISVKWETGELNLNLDEFFPAKKSKVKDLKEILKHSFYGKEKRDDILSYLIKKLNEFENHCTYLSNWNKKLNLEIINEIYKNSSDKERIRTLINDYKKWCLYFENATDLGLVDSRGVIDWTELLK